MFTLVIGLSTSPGGCCAGSSPYPALILGNQALPLYPNPNTISSRPYQTFQQICSTQNSPEITERWSFYWKKGKKLSDSPARIDIFDDLRVCPLARRTLGVEVGVQVLVPNSETSPRYWSRPFDINHQRNGEIFMKRAACNRLATWSKTDVKTFHDRQCKNWQHAVNSHKAGARRPECTSSRK
eukprot:1311383-Amphidinium_carterae.1